MLDSDDSLHPPAAGAAEGYAIEARPCCSCCNVLKGDTSLAEFRDSVARLNQPAASALRLERYRAASDGRR